MNLYQRLTKNQDLTDAEQHAASYLVQHADEIHLLSIQKIASASNTSIATVSRLCQNLGFRGFKDFRVKFYQDYLISLRNERQVNPDAPFSEGDPEFNVATNLAAWGCGGNPGPDKTRRNIACSTRSREGKR
ncbi:MAG: MurR/RpiR family transcriptional regulator [Atopobium sp.]|nr:MurR/RpiR family transcriptional regulator [Atopobium sp.]